MELEWRKASTCSSDLGCVEVAFGAAYVNVRATIGEEHSKPLLFTRDEWDAFVAGVKAGEFEGED